MLTLNDYKEPGRPMTELARESSEPTVAEALMALASDYLERAAKLHYQTADSTTASALGGHSSPAWQRRNKRLAQFNKSRTGGGATKKPLPALSSDCSTRFAPHRAGPRANCHDGSPEQMFGTE
jgi:hypothetical protein